MRRRVLRPFAILALAAASVRCASSEEAVEDAVDPAELGKAPFVGRWTSELDGATLEIEPTGVFGIDVPGKGSEPARGAVGRWSWNGSEVVFTDLRGSGACADLPGVYRAEVVRDTARFTLVRDECAPREEHMAWPWRRPDEDARR